MLNHSDAMGQLGHRGHKIIQIKDFFFGKFLLGHGLNSRDLASCETSKCRQFEFERLIE